MKTTIYIPVTTPYQKIEQVNMFWGSFIEIKLFGGSFDGSQKQP